MDFIQGPFSSLDCAELLLYQAPIFHTSLEQPAHQLCTDHSQSWLWGHPSHGIISFCWWHCYFPSHSTKFPSWLLLPLFVFSVELIDIHTLTNQPVFYDLATILCPSTPLVSDVVLPCQCRLVHLDATCVSFYFQLQLSNPASFSRLPLWFLSFLFPSLTWSMYKSCLSLAACLSLKTGGHPISLSTCIGLAITHSDILALMFVSNFLPSLPLFFCFPQLTTFSGLLFCSTSTSDTLLNWCLPERYTRPFLESWIEVIVYFSDAIYRFSNWDGLLSTSHSMCSWFQSPKQIGSLLLCFSGNNRNVAQIIMWRERCKPDVLADHQSAPNGKKTSLEGFDYCLFLGYSGPFAVCFVGVLLIRIVNWGWGGWDVLEGSSGFVFERVFLNVQLLECCLVVGKGNPPLSWSYSSPHFTVISQFCRTVDL